MKQGSTYFLRAVIFVLGLGALALCIFALPHLWRGGSEEFPIARRVLFLIMISLYLTAIPFFIALWQALKLLSYIDKNKAFSELSVKTLRNIKYCAIAISGLYSANVPLLYPIADADDAPGLIIIGAAIACAPVVIAVFAAVLERLLQSAIDLKSENDLTV
jgi:ABC-type tungstate transport system substrate-binding protein